MELRTEAVDRVLQALAPALNAEFEKVLQEAKQNLEIEFQKKLDAAVGEAQAASQKTAEGQLEKSVSEARETTRREVTEELQAQFNRTLQEKTDELRAGFTQEMQKVSSDWSTERASLSEQLEQSRTLVDAQRQLVEAGSQSEILVRFLKLAAGFAPSIAVYIAKADGLAMWKSRGDVAFPAIVSEGTIDPEWFFHQIKVRDKLVAAVCAANPRNAEGLNFLTSCLERSIESFGLKLRNSTPKAGEAEAARNV